MLEVEQISSNQLMLGAIVLEKDVVRTTLLCKG